MDGNEGSFRKPRHNIWLCERVSRRGVRNSGRAYKLGFYEREGSGGVTDIFLPPPWARASNPAKRVLLFFFFFMSGSFLIISLRLSFSALLSFWPFEMVGSWKLWNVDPLGFFRCWWSNSWIERAAAIQSFPDSTMNRQGKPPILRSLVFRVGFFSVLSITELFLSW